MDIYGYRIDKWWLINWYWWLIVGWWYSSSCFGMIRVHRVHFHRESSRLNRWRRGRLANRFLIHLIYWSGSWGNSRMDHPKHVCCPNGFKDSSKKNLKKERPTAGIQAPQWSTTKPQTNNATWQWDVFSEFLLKRHLTCWAVSLASWLDSWKHRNTGSRKSW